MVGNTIAKGVTPAFTRDSRVYKGQKMGNVISRDGTRIAFQRSGLGPPLVLVHGASATASRWATVLPALEQHFTVYAIDRRGRGQSGDAVDYAIEREFEDIAAVVSSIEEPVNLLGHSYGAICALEAALLVHKRLRRLVLYEPPVPVEGVALFPVGAIDKLQALLGTGDREGMMTFFSREVVRMAPSDFERFRSSPVWPARVASAHTLPRELQAHERYRLNPERFKGLTTPTLLLVGGQSPEIFTAGVKAANGAVPKSRVVTLAGQQHIAMDTAPELFVREVVTFLGAQ